jgi:hypothetical protein
VNARWMGREDRPQPRRRRGREGERRHLD